MLLASVWADAKMAATFSGAIFQVSCGETSYLALSQNLAMYLMKPVVRMGEADKKLVVGCCLQMELHKLHCVPAAGPLPCFDSAASDPSLIVFAKLAVLDKNGAVEEEDDSGGHAIVAAGRLRMGHGVAAKAEADLVARCNWKLNETVTAFVACRCEDGGQCTWPADAAYRDA